jgi:hypothetical protein
MVLALLRQPGARSWNTLWAEDGLYVQDAAHGSVTAPLMRGHAGYAQLVPRLLATGSRMVPVDRVSQFMAVAGAVMGALVAAFVYRCTQGWIEHRSLRLTLAALTALSPVLASENTANAVNTIWVLLFAAFWAIAARVARPADVVARAGVLFLAATSTPITALLVPFAATLVFVRRRAADVVAFVALLVGCGIQLLAIVATTDLTARYSSSAGDLPVLYGVRVLGTVAVGERWLNGSWDALGAGLGVLAAVAVIGALIAAALQSDTPRLQLAAVAMMYSVVLFVAPTWPRGTSLLRATLDVSVPGGARYAVVPSLLVGTALMVLVDQLRPPVVRRLLIAHSVVLGALNYSLANPRSAGPTWSSAVGAAREQCDGRTTGDALLPITPAGWSVRYPCDRLTD